MIGGPVVALSPVMTNPPRGESWAEVGVGADRLGDGGGGREAVARPGPGPTAEFSKKTPSGTPASGAAGFWTTE